MEHSTEEFGRLYDQYVKKIYRFIYFKTHHTQTAEDLTSLTFMKALENFHRFDDTQGTFQSWIYKIARNNVIDHYRNLRPTTDIEDAFDLSSQENVERDVDMRLKLETVEKYLSGIKSEQREIIILRVWGDHSFQEIAEILGKTEGSCKVAYKRAMDTLKEHFPLLTLLLLISKPL